MTIVIRSSKQIVALHDGIVYIFSVEALEGGLFEKNSPEPRIIGISIDNNLTQHPVFYGTQLCRLLLCKHDHVSTDDETGITSCPGCGAVKQKNGEWNNAESVVITKKRLKLLEYDSNKLAALEAGGVDNWEWYDISLKEFWEEED